MLNRKECKKMWVWDNRYDHKQKRIVIDRSSDGSCITVVLDMEDSFWEGKQYRIVKYNHYEEFIEPKYIALSPEELRDLVGTVVRDNRPEEYNKNISIIDYWKADSEQVVISGNYYTSLQVLSTWEMKVNGEWKPVGIVDNE